MKITAVIDSLTGGGAERTLLTLAVALQASGNSVTIITFKGDQIPGNTIGGCAHLSLNAVPTGPIPVPKFIRVMLRLRTALRASDPDLIISFMDQANLLSLLAVIEKRIPVFVCERVYPDKSSLMTISSIWLVKEFFRHLRNILYLKATRIVLQSERMHDYFPKYLQKKMIVIPNPIVAPTADGEATAIQNPSVVAIGRLVTQKRFDLLIEAFSEISQEFPEWHLQIVGSGPLESELRAHATRGSATHQIHFTGRQSNIAEILHNAKIFVLCSDYEGFPVALGEAMFCGVPVIASDCLTGPRELLGQSEWGILFSPGNSPELTTQLQMLMRSLEMRQYWGERARLRAKDFDLEKVLALWREHIKISNNQR